MDKRKERMERNRQKNIPTQHHIINKVKKDVYKNLTDKSNIVILPRHEHNGHHVSQKNNDPHETLFFYSFFMQVMSAKARYHLQEILKMTPEEFYDKKFLK